MQKLPCLQTDVRLASMDCDMVGGHGAHLCSRSAVRTLQMACVLTMASFGERPQLNGSFVVLFRTSQALLAVFHPFKVEVEK